MKKMILALIIVLILGGCAGASRDWSRPSEDAFPALKPLPGEYPN